MFTGVCLSTEKVSASSNYYSSYQVFYDELSPYGTWVYSPEYGYVWAPNVEAGFAPYATAGHWVFTFFGWTWVSDYAWGWAPFHYGRWFVDPYYGPLWIPGYEWGPAWVMWRSAPGYYGWAPMGPGYGYGYGYGYGHGHGHSYNVSDHDWVFVQNNYITNNYISNYYVDNSNNTTIINNSTVIMEKHINSKTNETFLSGPAVAEVQKYTGKSIKPLNVSDNASPGQKISGTELAIYKPKVEKNNGSGKTPAPAKVSQMKDLKQVNKPIGTGNRINNSNDYNASANKDIKNSPNSNTVKTNPNTNNNNKVNNGYSNKDVKQTPVNNNVNRNQNNNTNNNVNKGTEQKYVKPVNDTRNNGNIQKVNNNNNSAPKVTKQENNKTNNNSVRTGQPPVKSTPDNKVQKSNSGSGSPSKTKVSVRR